MEGIDDLKKDPVRNIALLGFFENYPVERVIREHDTWLLSGKSDHLWTYISGENPDELTGIFRNLQVETEYFASVEDWMVPVITKDSEIDWILSTRRYVLPEQTEWEPPVREVETLDQRWADYIFEQSAYQAFTSEEYIRERIMKGISAGIVMKDRLAAWAFTHDDNSLGSLHVLPGFRRKGYAMEVVRSLIGQKRKENRPVFLNIEPDNVNSIKLVGKLGFVFDRNVSWIKLKKKL